MYSPDANDARARISEFQKRHRIGLLTLVFTDMVASTRLKQELGDQRAFNVIQAHHELVRKIRSEIPESEEISTAGDSFFLVFAKPSDAVRFGLRLQTSLVSLSAENQRAIQDRVGIHVGEVVIQEGGDSSKQRDLYGLQVDIAARVMSLAEGTQILLTRSAFDHARQVLDSRELGMNEPLTWLNHGGYLFKGVEEPIEVCEVGSPICRLSPPADTEKARKHLRPGEEPVLGWRPANGQIVPGTEWELTRKLGEGSFGEVWAGSHRKLDQKRVFKFCFQADRVRSLRREVTLFRLLQKSAGRHPNIVGIQEVFFDEPPFYIMLDYADCQDLATWCEEQGGILSVPQAVRLDLVAQIADALQAAANAGVIHRDVKPSNILVEKTPGGIVARLTDFGIGAVVSADILGGTTAAGFTQTMLEESSGSRSGTQLYMAPELFSGGAPSPQSDIYALGVVLFQLLAGDFKRAVPLDWPKSISDPLLREDLHRCLAGDAGRRFSRAVQLAASLRTLPQRSRFGTRLWLQLRDHPWIVTAAVTIAGMVCLTTIYGLWQRTLFLEWKLTRRGHPPYHRLYSVDWQIGVWMLFFCLAAVGIGIIEPLRTGWTGATGKWKPLTSAARRRRVISVLIITVLALGFAGYLLKTTIQSRVWQLPDPFGGFTLVVTALFVADWGSTLALWQVLKTCAEAREETITERVLTRPVPGSTNALQFESGRPRLFKLLTFLALVIPWPIAFLVTHDIMEVAILAASGMYAAMLVRLIVLLRASRGRFFLERSFGLLFSLIIALGPPLYYNYPAAWIPLIAGVLFNLATLRLAKSKPIRDDLEAPVNPKVLAQLVSGSFIFLLVALAGWFTAGKNWERLAEFCFFVFLSFNVVHCLRLLFKKRNGTEESTISPGLLIFVLVLSAIVLIDYRVSHSVEFKIEAIVTGVLSALIPSWLPPILLRIRSRNQAAAL